GLIEPPAARAYCSPAGRPRWKFLRFWPVASRSALWGVRTVAGPSSARVLDRTAPRPRSARKGPIERRRQMTLNARLGSTLVLGALALGSAGCVATRDWVNQQIAAANGPLQTKIAQLGKGIVQGKTAHDQLNGRVTQVDGRVTNVDGRVNQVAAQVEARTVANEGVQKAGAVDERLTRTLANRYRRELFSTVTLLFPPGKSALLPV